MHDGPFVYKMPFTWSQACLVLLAFSCGYIIGRGSYADLSTAETERLAHVDSISKLSKSDFDYRAKSGQSIRDRALRSKTRLSTGGSAGVVTGCGEARAQVAQLRQEVQQVSSSDLLAGFEVPWSFPPKARSATSALVVGADAGLSGYVACACMALGMRVVLSVYSGGDAGKFSPSCPAVKVASETYQEAISQGSWTYIFLLLLPISAIQLLRGLISPRCIVYVPPPSLPVSDPVPLRLLGRNGTDYVTLRVPPMYGPYVIDSCNLGSHRRRGIWTMDVRHAASIIASAPLSPTARNQDIQLGPCDPPAPTHAYAAHAIADCPMATHQPDLTLASRLLGVACNVNTSPAPASGPLPSLASTPPITDVPYFYTWRDVPNPIPANVRDEDLLPNTRAFQDWLWRYQHPTDCGARLVLEYRIPSYGIGAAIHLAASAAWEAIAADRLLLFERPWHYGMDESCAVKGPECYFLPITNCTRSMYNAKDVMYVKRPDELIRSVASQRRHGQWTNKPRAWLMAQLVAYLMRPNKITSQYLVRERKALLPEGITRLRPMVSVHVRHGDKFLENAPVPFPTFVKAAEEVRMRVLPDARDMWLSTEDPDVVASANALTRWDVHYTNFPRVVGGVGPVQLAMRFGRRRMTLHSLLNLWMAAEGDAFVGSLSSNWCRLIHELRGVWGKARTYTVDVECAHGCTKMAMDPYSP
eukprot:NODE_562_length_2319_cov_114.519581_g534_i0.p1 GENE.NODE_562_length_2319_cov_114.519581_g534_i0~~NODE_562_length_2319_cov_114.519581_g534_i0.p1  ORF type:complete len:700 (-),score=69.86 NODE_562_length_2319_cov_114.519581_g534_i0:135-2234(-)